VDRPSLLLLQHIARHATNDRLLLMATYRDVELERTHPLSEALLGLGGASPYQIAASLILMLLILIPYVGFAAIAEALGVENLLGVMIQRAEAEVVRSHKK